MAYGALSARLRNAAQLFHSLHETTYRRRSLTTLFKTYHYGRFSTMSLHLSAAGRLNPLHLALQFPILITQVRPLSLLPGPRRGISKARREQPGFFIVHRLLQVPSDQSRTSSFQSFSARHTVLPLAPAVCGINIFFAARSRCAIRKLNSNNLLRL